MIFSPAEISSAEISPAESLLVETFICRDVHLQRRLPAEISPAESSSTESSSTESSLAEISPARRSLAVEFVSIVGCFAHFLRWNKPLPDILEEAAFHIEKFHFLR